jgi:positive phototaxis protein PixI
MMTIASSPPEITPEISLEVTLDIATETTTEPKIEPKIEIETKTVTLQDTPKTEQFLSFSLSTSIAIVSTQNLTEVLTLSAQQIIPIPDLDRSVMGVCNWRGEVLWLVDLDVVLNGTPLPPPQGTHYSAIILHHNGQTLGLVVSQITQMVWCSAADIQPLPRTKQMPHTSPFIQGYCASSQSDPFLVLNTAEIFTKFQR